MKPTPVIQWNPERMMQVNLLRFLAWVDAGKCKIIDRNNPGDPAPMKMRVGQLEVIKAMLRQAARRKPIRVLVPKYRRHGISTIVQALFQFLVRVLRYRNARMVAHESEAAEGIFQIANLIYEESGGKDKSGKNKSLKRIEPKGMNSLYQCSTGLGRFTGSGSTTHFLHISEVAKFPNTSEQDKRAMESMINSVAQTSPETIIVQESSGQGKDGIFPETCLETRDILLEGKEEPMWEIVFLPWVLDTENVVDEDELPDEFDPPLVGEELLLQKSHKATDGQLAWRRKTLRNLYKHRDYAVTPVNFGWDYPLTLEEAFGQKAGRIFPNFRIEKHVKYLPADHPWGARAYKTRWIDWGGSENHAFVCLWAHVDPDQPSGLVVSPECTNLIRQMETYARDPKTGRRIKDKDDTCDALRIGIATFSVEGLCYIYREYYTVNPSDSIPSTLAKRIHRESRWHHPSGDDNHSDISAFAPGSTGENYSFGGDFHDERFTWKDEAENENFRKAMYRGAGVADGGNGSQHRHIQMFTEWGIPLIPHVKPKGSTAESAVEDGIGLINVLIEGDAQFRPTPVKDNSMLLAMTAREKLSARRQILPSDEELAALREYRGVSVAERDGDEEYDSWSDVD